MRTAIFSDVHANLEAFEAVLDDASRSDISRYFFVGDIVGYGADPAACIRTLKTLDAVVVAGNHDWAVSGDLAIRYFNEAAAAAVDWTQSQVSLEDKILLGSWPLVNESGVCCLVHGTLDHPEEFDYMTDARRASKTFLALEKQFCFVGHLHQSGIFLETNDGIVYHPGRGEWRLKAEERAIINVGSVGQPRDGDPGACYCVFDLTRRVLEFRRVSYDIQKTADKIIAAGLPEVLADRLFVGR